ncbi:hypothetical protein [uncultured Secundilactobacillus sp.]|uniref:hypothetical protein n=1 Tax=uncultured Secundilactobacillus sp. TaxID=2813935 RepID=UPI0025907D51|nr:hypothetical protein [uncultured Secundilactobacillus sp.]
MQTSHQLPPKIKAVWQVSALGSGLVGAVVVALLILAHHLWSWPLWLAAAAGVMTVVDVLVS